GRDGDLTDRAGHRDASDREQVVHGEMETDSEHEQDHADLRELTREPNVGDIAGSEGADGHAGDEVPEKRRKFQTGRNQTKQESQAETSGQNRKELRLVGHALARYHEFALTRSAQSPRRTKSSRRSTASEIGAP